MTDRLRLVARSTRIAPRRRRGGARRRRRRGPSTPPGGPSTYRINAVYASAPGLFPGAAVDVLGVPVGTVTSVKNVANRVEVGMQVRSGTRIPARR